MRTLQDIRHSVANRIETYVTTNLSGLWKLVARVPVVHRRVNGILIDRAILKIPTRPNPLSPWRPIHPGRRSPTGRMTVVTFHLPSGRARLRPSRRTSYITSTAWVAWTAWLRPGQPDAALP
jgi:hypothetical protein